MKKQLLVVMSVVALLSVSKSNGTCIKDPQNVTILNTYKHRTISLNVGDKIGLITSKKYIAKLLVDPNYFEDTTREDVEPKNMGCNVFTVKKRLPLSSSIIKIKSHYPNDSTRKIHALPTVTSLIND